MELIEELIQKIDAGDRSTAVERMKEWAGINGYDRLMDEILDPVLKEVGERWMREDISLAQSYIAAKIAGDILEQIASDRAADSKPDLLLGPVVLGNIEADFHALGRRMVVMFLKATRWEVHDLGNDVPPVEFVNKAVEVGAKIIGASAMMYTSAENIKLLRADIVFMPFVLPYEGEAFGSRCEHFESQPPNLRQPAISSSDEIADLTVPDIDSCPGLQYMLEALDLLVSEHGKETMVAGIAMSPVDLPMMIMGLEGWLQTILFNHAGTESLLEITRTFFINWANAQFARGADFIALPVVFLNPSVVSLEIAETISLPVFNEVLPQINGPVVIHHTGAKFLSALELLIDLPNVLGFVIDHRDSFSVAREIIGDELTMLGGLDGPNIGKFTPEEIKSQCKKILEDRQDDPRFILSTSGADIALDTPAENIRAILEAVESGSQGITGE